jgi:hypothetical protein
LKKAALVGGLLLVRVLERLDFAVALPKLHVVTVSEALGVFFRDIIVRANKFYRSDKVTVCPDHVRSISGHLRSPPQ